MANCVQCDKNEKLDSFDKCVECIKYILSKPVVVIDNVMAYINSYRHGSTSDEIQGCKIRISHMPHHAPRALWATKISAQDAREGAHIMTQGRIQNFVLERARYIKIGKLNYLCQLITTK